jgi:6-phosphogluconolactonase (cycloisomerase 2 family)
MSRGLSQCKVPSCFSWLWKGKEMRFSRFSWRRFSFSMLAFVGILLLQSPKAVADDEGGAVYVLGNQNNGNTVIVFRRAEDGTLTRLQEVSTHGLGGGGTNDPLGSQGALALSTGGHLLLAVNAGSNELSVLSVGEDGIRFANKISSGGERPVSVTTHGNLAYVLNAGGTPNISGFFVGPSARLRPIPNSTRPLAGGAAAAPAEVQFSPDGDLLLVTEKGTNLIDIFAVDDDGRILSHTTQSSNNTTPFGFSFRRGGDVVVSEAAGGAPGGSTVSSYRVVDQDGDGDDLKTISKSVPDTQTAACWIVVSRTGRVAFASNTGSGTISSFDVKPGGALSLTESVAGSLGAGSGVIDMALSRGSRFLYVLSSNLGTVTGFRVSGGHLVQVTSIGGLPASIQGLAAQ